MSELVTVTLKMTTELRDRLKARATAVGTSVSALLIDGVSGAAKPDPRLAELEAQVATLAKDRDQWRDRAKAIVSAGAGVPIPRVDAVATKTIGHHAAGPILPATGLNVSGQTTTTRFRAGSEAEKSLKSWQK